MSEPHEADQPARAPAPLTRERAIELLRSGEEGLDEWHLYRSVGGPIPDLSGADLRRGRAELIEGGPMTLDGTDFKGAKLVGANLEGVPLRNANLDGADLSAASLDGAHLDKARLAEANLEGASLNFATLVGASLTNARLGDATLYHADLRDAKLGEADLAGATLAAADLRGAYLAGAFLNRADLGEADCRGAHFDDASIDPDLSWLGRVLLFDWVNWQTVRSVGSLQVLTKVSYLMLAAVPLLAGVWLGLRQWAEPAGLSVRMPSAWGHAFFAALFAAAGHLVYQLWAPDLVKESTAEKFVEQVTAGFSIEAPDRDDRLTRATAALRELAAIVPDLHNANLVERHGRVVWVPSKLEHFRELPPDDSRIPPEAGGPPAGPRPRVGVDHGLMRVAVEEGAKAEYAIQSHQGRPAAAVALALYAAAAALICWLVANQAWGVARAVGWV